MYYFLYIFICLSFWLTVIIAPDITLFHYIKWYFRKLTFEQKALIDPNPGLLIFVDDKFQKELYVDTKYIFNYLNIQTDRRSYRCCGIDIGFNINSKLLFIIKEIVIPCKRKIRIYNIMYVKYIRSPITKKGQLWKIYGQQLKLYI